MPFNRDSLFHSRDENRSGRTLVSYFQPTLNSKEGFFGRKAREGQV